MACVRKRRGKWVLDYRDQHGKRHWETTELNKKGAELLLAERLQEVGRGEYQEKREEKTFEELIEAYNVAHLSTNVRDTTRLDYQSCIKCHLLPYFTGWKIRAITPAVVEAYRGKLLEQGVGRRTINKSLTLMGSMFRYALKHRWLSYNPAALVKKLREDIDHHEKPVESNTLQPDEIARLLEAADDPLAHPDHDGNPHWPSPRRAIGVAMGGCGLGCPTNARSPDLHSWPLLRSQDQDLTPTCRPADATRDRPEEMETALP